MKVEEKHDVIHKAIDIIGRCSEGYYVAYKTDGEFFPAMVCHEDDLVNNAYDIVGGALEAILSSAEKKGLDKKKFADEIVNKALNAEPFVELEEDDE